MKGILTLEFLSDTSFSMPASRDSTVDSDVALDNLGLPTAPGKTLHGLLRDTWLMLGDPAPPEGIALLGRPRSNEAEGKLRIGTARVSDKTLRGYIDAALTRGDRGGSGNPLPESALPKAFLGTRFLTAQDRETGSPKTETLRLVRVVPAGTRLTASLTVRGTLSNEERELFALLCDLTRHAGLDRNRGLGHIRLSVTWEEPPTVVKLPTAAPEARGTRFLPLQLKLTEPALLTSSELDANSRISRDYIPGSAVRGAVAALLEVNGADDTLLHSLLASGSVRWLNAYPADAENQRGLPVPITARRDKDATKDSDGDAAPEDEIGRLLSDMPEPSRGQRQRTPLKAKFLAQDHREYTTTSSKKVAHTHQSRDRETGVTRKEGVATVYVYEALDEAQIFIGGVAIPEGAIELEAVLRALLEQGPLFLGRSSKSQYGGLPKVVLGEVSLREPGVPEPPTLSEGDSFIVRLTSDAIVRNAYGQHDPYALQKALQSRLEGLAIVGKVGVKQATAQGYSRLWRNELPGVPAAAMGSVALCTATREVTPDELIELQVIPLGERTTEGYGCWASFPMPQEFRIASEDPQKAKSEPDAPEPESLLAAQRRLYEARLRPLLAQHAIDLAGKASSPPPPSTTQRLRTALRGEDWDVTLKTWLTGSRDERLKVTAYTKLESCRLGGKKLSVWLVELLAKEDNWPQFDFDTQERLRYRLVSEAKSVQLWAETKRALRRHYLDTLLSRLAKVAQEESK
jgi:CRISPR-associated protein Csx10